MNFCKFKKMTLGLAVAACFMAMPVFAQEAFPGEARLNSYAAGAIANKDFIMGYPCNQNLRLEGFYKWFMEKKMYLPMMNNAGDPFAEHHYVSALPFEREVIEYFAPKYGFTLKNVWGFVSNSGTDGNNHGIYFGAKYLKSITDKKPIVYVSKEAHYSIMRLCDLQNLEFRLIDTDKHGRMEPKALEKALNTQRPALVVYALGTTFKGAIDNQAALNAVLEKKKPLAVYRHVDAALFGGYLPFTDRKELVDRNVQPFDSIAISGHKFIGMDEPSGLFLTTKEVYARQTAFDVPYLNAEMPMINCSRDAIAPVKMWWLIKNDGDAIWTREAKEILDTTKWLCNQLEAIDYPHYVEEASNTVYMKRPSEEIVNRFALAMDYDERLGGELAHLVVMQHVSKANLQLMLDALKNE